MILSNRKTGQIFNMEKPHSSKILPEMDTLSPMEQKVEFVKKSAPPVYYDNPTFNFSLKPLIISTLLLSRVNMAAATEPGYVFHNSSDVSLCSNLTDYHCTPFYITDPSNINILNGSIATRIPNPSTQQPSCSSNTLVTDSIDALFNTLSMNNTGNESHNDLCVSNVTYNYNNDNGSGDIVIAEITLNGLSQEGCDNFKSNLNKTIQQDSCVNESSESCCCCCFGGIICCCNSSNSASATASCMIGAGEAIEKKKPDYIPSPSLQLIGKNRHGLFSSSKGKDNDTDKESDKVEELKAEYTPYYGV